MRVAFGECLLDTDSHELLRKGRPVHLSPKAFAFLTALLEARPRVLTKAELHDRLWPRTFVSPTSLGRLLAEVRAALGDDARQPRFIRTVHSCGYAFCATVGGPSDGPALRLCWGPREFALGAGEHVLGRSRECGVRLDSPGVSRRHARIVVAEGAACATLEDLGSQNGTWCQGRRVLEPQPLADGDLVTLGQGLAFTVRLPASEASTVAEDAG